MRQADRFFGIMAGLGELLEFIMDHGEKPVMDGEVVSGACLGVELEALFDIVPGSIQFAEIEVAVAEAAPGKAEEDKDLALLKVLYGIPEVLQRFLSLGLMAQNVAVQNFDQTEAVKIFDPGGHVSSLAAQQTCLLKIAGIARAETVEAQEGGIDVVSSVETVVFLALLLDEREDPRGD